MMERRKEAFTKEDGISLKEYFDTRCNLCDKATTLARESMEKRLEGMNEFRETLKDQASRFITRDEMETKIEALEKSKKDNIALLISLLSIALGIFAVIHK